MSEGGASSDSQAARLLEAVASENDPDAVLAAIGDAPTEAPRLFEHRPNPMATYSREAVESVTETSTTLFEVDTSNIDDSSNDGDENDQSRSTHDTPNIVLTAEQLQLAVCVSDSESEGNGDNNNNNESSDDDDTIVADKAESRRTSAMDDNVDNDINGDDDDDDNDDDNDNENNTSENHSETSSSSPYGRRCSTPPPELPAAPFNQTLNMIPRLDDTHDASETNIELDDDDDKPALPPIDELVHDQEALNDGLALGPQSMRPFLHPSKSLYSLVWIIFFSFQFFFSFFEI